jgi:AraC-like DNA-binding protein
MTSYRPKGISDLDILWAIRDIPKSILNSSRKGILSMFIAIIGQNERCTYSMAELEDKLGCTDRSLRENFHYLEEINFLIIERPSHYVKGAVNHYKINYEKILEEANLYRN